MSRKRYTPEQIISMLREAEVALAQGQSVGQACRTLGVSEIIPSGRIARSDTDHRPQKPSCQTLMGQPTLLRGYGWRISLTRAKL